VILVVCALIAVATVPLTGASLRPMAALPIKHLWLVWLAIGVQTALVSAPWHPPQALGQILHLVSYVLAGVFAIRNRSVPGVPVIAAGGLLNALAIFANGGVMPASPGALRAAGIASDGEFSNSAAVTDARLQILGDVFAIPAGWPLSNVFSIGDIVVVVGIAYLAHRQCRRPAFVGDAASSTLAEPQPAS
jgi:Family of unknown function (DUF5317)